MRTFKTGASALMLLVSTHVVHGSNTIADDVADLQRQVQLMRADYEQRIGDLEARLALAESRTQTAQRSAESAQEIAEELASAPQPVQSKSASTFNPSIGAVLIGTLADVGTPSGDIPGFQSAAEPGPADGFSLGETEINFNASIDDKFFGNLTFALADEDGELAVELEEAWLQTTALPAHFRLRFGRQFSSLGYLNGFHRHADDFIDRPLPYQVFLAGQYLDDGVQLSWLAPTDTFIEMGAEAMKGDKFPGSPGSDGQDIWTLFLKSGGDIGLSHSWKAGLSFLSADVAGRTGGHGHGPEDGDELEGFFGDSNLYSLEGVYKWAPSGNSTVTNLTIQGEYFWRDESGILDGHVYDGDQKGWYLQGVYQFQPGWRIGYRHDRLDSGNRGIQDIDFDPSRDSLIVEWINSEFSSIRLQYSHDRSTPIDDDLLYLQYIMSMGAHRAHQF